MSSVTLIRFFERLTSLGFFARLFGWSSIRREAAEAQSVLQRLIALEETWKEQQAKLDRELSVERTESRNAREQLIKAQSDLNAARESLQRTINEFQTLREEKSKIEEKSDNYYKRGMELKARYEQLEESYRKLRSDFDQLKATESQSLENYKREMNTLRIEKEDVRKERQREIDERHAAEMARIQAMEATWSVHEQNVKARMKALCSRHGIEYVEKVPFKGNPDNTIRIKDEYIVFDAKSPRTDNFSAFKTYVKTQVESALKYVREEDVRKEVFLVVPTNTLDTLDQFEFRLADYTVYVIPPEALEPIVLALRKIEDYEFADQLSPEERENICRVIGKFVHLSKRRIQIDNFFARQFFELVHRSEAELPREILEKTTEFERSERLNPPQEKRAKQINTRDLETDIGKIAGEAGLHGIEIPDAALSKSINSLPLSKPAQGVGDDQVRLFPEP